MFIEIDGRLVNLDQVIHIFKINSDCIRICFNNEHIDVERSQEEEVNKTWEWLRCVCLRKAGEQE